MLQTSIWSPSFWLKVCCNADTRVVFPAPCTPFKPMKNGLSGFCVWWAFNRCRMKGMQCGDLSSMIMGFDETSELAEVVIVPNSLNVYWRARMLQFSREILHLVCEWGPPLIAAHRGESRLAFSRGKCLAGVTNPVQLIVTGIARLLWLHALSQSKKQRYLHRVLIHVSLNFPIRLKHFALILFVITRAFPRRCFLFCSRF